MQAEVREGFSGRVIKTCAFAGLQLIDGIYPARTRVPDHSHEEAVFCVALSGSCDEAFAGKQRQYEAPTVGFLPANQSHSLYFPSADTRAFSIDVAGAWIERAREYSLRMDDSVHARGGMLSGLMMRIYGEFRNPDSASPLAIQGLTMDMLAAVARNNSNRSICRRRRRLSLVVEILRESFTEQTTLAQLASAAGVHPVYLAREFRRVHRCTIGEYVRRLRVEQACRQLSSSGESLTAIAASAGFSDQSHFSRTFKRLMGMTPTQYRASFDTH